MNIFILHTDPVEAAKQQCDKHVVKMVLESAQIMCTVRSLQGLSSPYRPTHAGHPCVKWACEPSNYSWLYSHFSALLAEYTKRYNKTHKCAELLGLLQATDTLSQPAKFVQCMPEQYKHADTVTAYRSYYRGDKSRFAAWLKGTPAPEWMQC